MTELSFLIFLATSLAIANEQAVPDLATIRSRYVETITSIHSLDCQYSVSREFSTSLMKDFGDSIIIASKVRLSQSGSRRAYTIEDFNSKSESTMRRWHGYDGKTFAHWDESLIPMARRKWLPTGVVGSERDLELYATDGIERFLGEGLYGGLAPLHEILTNTDKVQVVGWEKVNGHSCVKVVIAEHVATVGDLVRATSTVWFDPEQRFLPRRIATEPQFLQPSKNSSLVTYETLEFATVTGNDGETYLFPKRCYFDSAIADSLVTLDEVRINGPVDADQFIPKFPDLTEVRQQLPNGQQLTYIVGDAKKREELEKIMMERRRVRKPESDSPPASQPDPKPVSPPSAKPRDQSSLSPWLLRSAGLLVCGVAIAVWVRNRQT